MRIGTVFDQTSTTEFLVMLDQQCDSEQLLFSYIEVSPDGHAPNPGGERIIGRITNVLKENPLLILKRLLCGKIKRKSTWKE